jgi:hypothetical protein
MYYWPIVMLETEQIDDRAAIIAEGMAFVCFPSGLWDGRNKWAVPQIVSTVGPDLGLGGHCLVSSHNVGPATSRISSAAR